MLQRRRCAGKTELCELKHRCSDIEQAYGGYLRVLGLLGFLSDHGERITLSDRGSFWLHACEDILSIDYISWLWGASTREP
jgi:hypothetical protein